VTLGILLGGLGFMASAAGWCLLLREREEARILRDALEVQLSCLRGTLEKIEDSSEGLEFGLAKAEALLRDESGTDAAAVVHQASKEAHSTRRFCREFRRTLQVTRQTVNEESQRQRRETPIRILAGARKHDDAWAELVRLADAAERLAA
jgi:hypothetical protein